MKKTLQWAALPPTAKLCLQTALTHHGLIKTEAGYVGRTDWRPAPPHFGAVVVGQLMRDGLATASTFNERMVSLTDAALVLMHLGSAAVEVAP